MKKTIKTGWREYQLLGKLIFGKVENNIIKQPFIEIGRILTVSIPCDAYNAGGWFDVGFKCSNRYLPDLKKIVCRSHTDTAYTWLKWAEKHDLKIS